jgi:hypothetical protein
MATQKKEVLASTPKALEKQAEIERKKAKAVAERKRKKAEKMQVKANIILARAKTLVIDLLDDDDDAVHPDDNVDIDAFPDDDKKQQAVATVNEPAAIPDANKKQPAVTTVPEPAKDGSVSDPTEATITASEIVQVATATAPQQQQQQPQKLRHQPKRTKTTVAPLDNLEIGKRNAPDFAFMMAHPPSPPARHLFGDDNNESLGELPIDWQNLSNLLVPVAVPQAISGDKVAPISSSNFGIQRSKFIQHLHSKCAEVTEMILLLTTHDRMAHELELSADDKKDDIICSKAEYATLKKNALHNLEVQSETSHNGDTVRSISNLLRKMGIKRLNMDMDQSEYKDGRERTWDYYNRIRKDYSQFNTSIEDFTLVLDKPDLLQDARSQDQGKTTTNAPIGDINSTTDLPPNIGEQQSTDKKGSPKSFSTLELDPDAYDEEENDSSQEDNDSNIPSNLDETLKKQKLLKIIWNLHRVMQKTQLLPNCWNLQD